MYDSWTP